MPEKEIWEKLDERLDEIATWVTAIHTALVGIPNTESKGLCGEVKVLKDCATKQSGRIRRLEIIVACILVGSGGGYGLSQLIL